MMKSLCVLLCMVTLVRGHGRVVKPAGRASAWRYGFGTPTNYNDNQMFCGGFFEQQQAGYKCGVCGDPYDLTLNENGIRPHEAGGSYATGTIVAYYQQGQTIDVHVQLTANHFGHMSFKICPVNDHTVKATQECMDQTPLQYEDGSYFYPVTSSTPIDINLRLKLPSNLVCDQCVIQWRYHAGNSWGCGDTGCGMGLGEQEEFYACSDVKIGGDGGSGPTGATTTPTTTSMSATTTSATTTSTTTTTTAASGTGGECSNYIAAGAWFGDANMDSWCAVQCPAYCPPTHCMCGDGQ